MRHEIELDHLIKYRYRVLVIFFIFGMISCSDSNITNNNIEEINEGEPVISAIVKEAISALGFNPEGAELIGDYYLVEGEIGISKATINEGIHACEASKSKSNDIIHHEAPDPMNQWAANSTVIGINKVSNMTYHIDSSIPTNKHGLIHEAVDMWNDVSGSRLELLEDNSSPDITFYRYDSAPYSCLNFDPLTSLGRALFPENGNPGAAITLKTFGVTDLSFKTTTAHELGHAFGFRHSNWQNSESSSGTSACGTAFNAIRIGNTPYNDSNSIMKAGSGTPTSISFYDERALRIMYPISLSAPNKPEISEVHCGPGGGRSFTVSYPLYNTAHNIEVWNNVENGSWQMYTSANAENTSSTPAYTSFTEDPDVYVKIRQANYAGNYFSSFSPVLHSPPACN